MATLAMCLPLLSCRPLRSGFTLVELLLVIAVLAILAGLSFGVATGVSHLRDRSRARAELAVLEQALERFRLRHGDYPHAAGEPASTDNGAQLYAALAGGTPLLDRDALDAGGEPACFLDPWGRPYGYLYDGGSDAWEHFGYLLFSHGPDGVTAMTTREAATGVLGGAFTAAPANADVILAGR